MAYATVADARAEGVPNTILDAAIQAQIDIWSQFIDKACRQWFESRAVTLDLDGTDARVLFLPVPIISLTSLFVNSDFTTALPTTHYKVYSHQTQLRDDRRNPRIEMASSDLNIFSPNRYSVFVAGTQNQRLVGNFGFVESDGSTPKLIKRAVLKLAIKHLAASPNGLWNEVAAGNPSVGSVASESTDGHSISYNAFSIKPTVPGLNGITNDPEVDNIIKMYKGPILITSTQGVGGPDRRWQ